MLISLGGPPRQQRRQKAALTRFSNFLSVTWNSHSSSKDLSKFGTIDETRMYNYLEDNDLDFMLIVNFAQYLTHNPSGYHAFETVYSYVRTVCSYFTGATSPSNHNNLNEERLFDCFCWSERHEYHMRKIRKILSQQRRQESEHVAAPTIPSVHMLRLLAVNGFHRDFNGRLHE